MPWIQRRQLTYLKPCIGLLMLVWLLLAVLSASEAASPGDVVLFSGTDLIDIPFVQQNGFTVLDSRSAGTCSAGTVVRGINIASGPLCEAGGGGGGNAGAFYVVTAADASLPNARVLGTAIIMRGTHAARPAAGTNGRVYFYTDAPLGWARDNGTSWDESQIDWGQITNAVTMPHASSHSPGQPDDISGMYATKAYADAISQGLDIKLSVVTSTIAPLPANTYANGTGGIGATLTGTSNGALAAQDGVTLTVNQSLLVKDEASGLKNGIYTLTTVGDGSNPYVLTRRIDADSEINAGMFTFVEQGSTLADTGWVLITNNPITVGTTALSFSQFSGGGTVLGGAGILKTGNVLDILAGTCITVGADTVGISAACITDTQIASLNADKLTSGTVPPARLPVPTTTTLGGVKSFPCATPTPYMSGIDTTGTIQCVGDVSGSGGLPPSVLLSNLLGSSVTAIGFIPANSWVLGVQAEVVTTVTGVSDFQVGVPGDEDRFGASLSGILGTVSNIATFQVEWPQYYGTATDVVVTGNGGDFTGGDVRLYIYYTTLATFAIPGVGEGGRIVAVEDTVDSLDGEATVVSVTESAQLRFRSSDLSAQFQVSQAETLPIPIVDINLHVPHVETDTLNSVFSRPGGNEITNPTSLTPFRIGPANGLHWEWYIAGGIPVHELVDGSGNPISRSFHLGAGLTWSWNNSNSVPIMRLTESTGALTEVTLDAEASNNTLTIPAYWDLDLVGVAGGTASHIWNDDPLSTACTPTAVIGANRTTGVCTFPNSDGDYGRQITRYLPDGWTGSFDAVIWWQTTGTGNARFHISTKCYADDEVADAVFNPATIVTAPAGTSGRPNKQTITGISTTGCAAGELMRIRFFRNRTEASDNLTAALDVEKVVFKLRVAH